MGPKPDRPEFELDSSAVVDFPQPKMELNNIKRQQSRRAPGLMFPVTEGTTRASWLLLLGSLVVRRGVGGGGGDGLEQRRRLCIAGKARGVAWW
ncbi:glutaredoxin-C6-like [Pyrus ussuriensis x Pyrus communis]|uniref:Glutaredoxin-C6-like n=1 Tax=Pyrus ussuriensis x Pyrus communis TaxID=2448454 RepID=A0A5N5I7S0_9ROSA|nr:glutaredoxin-C6-like [Pyrus ussuriensis x Pyrus communis]